MSAGLSLLLVEDNEMVREEMILFLARQGWQVRGVDCGEDLNHALMAKVPDIVILDVNLPYEDGYSIASRLRQSHPHVGIVMLTARVRPGDRIEGYRAGADVYLTKPTQTAELLAVIQNLSLRLQPISTAELLLDVDAARLILSDGQTCHLTRTEAKFLEILALSPGREADNDFLAMALAGNESRQVTRDNLSVLVSRLRSKFHELDELANLVVTRRGLGYRLSLPVRVK